MEATKPVTLIVDGAPMRFASIDEAMKQVMVEHGRWVATRAANLAQRIRCGMWLTAIKEVLDHGDFYPLLARYKIPPKQSNRAMAAYREDEDKKVGRGFAADLAGPSKSKSDILSDLKTPHSTLKPKYEAFKPYGTLRRIADRFGAGVVLAPDFGPMTHDQRRMQNRALAALYKCQQQDPEDRDHEFVLMLMHEALNDVAKKAPPLSLPAWVPQVSLWILSVEVPRVREERALRQARAEEAQAKAQADFDKGLDDEADALLGQALGPTSQAAGGPAAVGGDLLDDDSDLGIDDADWDRVPRAEQPGSAAGGGVWVAGGGGVGDGGAKGQNLDELNTSPPVSLPGGVGLSQPPGAGKKAKPVQLTFAAEYQAAMQRAVDELMATVKLVQNLELSEHAAAGLLAEIQAVVRKARNS